jgi:sugar transferase (PEP-CTERM/EpsH1 system associated)
MNLLVLDEEFPYPLNSGKRIRSFNLWSRLARKHTVRYLAYGREDSAEYKLFADHLLNPIAVPPQIPKKSGPMFYLRLLATLFSSEPYIVTSHYSEAFLAAMQAAIRKETPHLIVCEWSPYARFVRDITDIKTVVVAHNIEATIWRRYYENETNPLKRWYIGRQAAKVEAFEKSIFRTVKGATAVSDEEAGWILSVNPNLNVSSIDNGVDLEYFSGDNSRQQPRTIVFTGSMDWRPNQDCVTYFVEDIFPILRRTYPDLSAVFVGRNPPEHIVRYGDRDGIEITGTVDDVRGYINDASVYVVPLRIGGGSRLKILEALSMQKAVVSTSVGAEGLEITPDENIVLADAPEQFAAAVSTLVENPERRAALGKAGRQLVERRYGWDFLAGRLAEFLASVAGTR